MDKVEVTIWCLAYNHGKYIRKALEGFVKQKTSFSFEVIIHDDASSDDTVEIIKEYYERYPNIIVPIYEEENQYGKKNYLHEYCLKYAKGKYIAFCEGDDYWIDDLKLQKQYDAMEANEQSVLCVHKTKCTNEDDSYNSMTIPSDDTVLGQSREISQQEFAKLLFVINTYPFHTSSYFIRRSLFEDDEIRLKLTNFFNGDETYLLQSLRVGTIFYINEFMSCRRLLTVGNWNNRFNASSDDYKFSFYKKKIDGMLYFNELTEKKYNKLIAYRIYSNICNMAIVFDLDKVNDLIKQVKNAIRYPHFVSLKLDIRYCLMLVSSRLYKKLMKNRINSHNA